MIKETRGICWIVCLLLFEILLNHPALSQERAYMITYDHYLEEPGNLEVEYFSTFATQHGGHNFHSYWGELEYGVKAWFTTEFYLDGQTTFGDSTIFTGFRWENRIRPFQHEHFLNPVLYFEYEQSSDADKLMKGVEGHSIATGQARPNAFTRRTINHELEFKLLLSKTLKGWNVAINPIAAKPLLPSAPWKFGYAMGVSHPLGLKASTQRCNFCRENFNAGVEIYGGLGDTQSFGLHQTSHYLAPVLAWNIPSGWTLRLSPGFGLNDNSHGFVLRWGLSREFEGFGDKVKRFFRGK